MSIQAMPMSSVVQNLEEVSLQKVTKFMGLPPSEWALILLLLAIAVLCVLSSNFALAAGGTLPGDDPTSQMKAAGSMLQFLDTAMFKWFARIFAGICIMSGGWALKEQRFGVAVVCIIGALVFGTATQWVKNVFAISGGDSVFTG